MEKKKALERTAAALFWLAVWEAAARIIAKPLLLPSLTETVSALFRLIQTGAFWESTMWTMVRVVTGFVGAAAAGAALAVLCFCFRPADVLLSPLRSVIRATPVTSFIILVLLWIERGRVPAFISFLMVLPLVWTQVQTALQNTDAQLIEMTRMYRFSFGKQLRYLYFPSVLPHFTAACMNGLGFAWKSGIAAEVIALPAMSIGKNLYDAKINLERADLFAWTLTVIILSILLEKGLKKLVGRLGKGAKADNA